MVEKREPARSERLNAGCFYLSLDNALLHNAVSTELGAEKIAMLVEERCHFLFSARPVFISETQATRMADVVAAIEAVVALPAYQKHVLADEPDIARRNSGGALKRLFLIRVGLPSEMWAYSIGMIQIS